MQSYAELFFAQRTFESFVMHFSHVTLQRTFISHRFVTNGTIDGVLNESRIGALMPL